VTALGRKFPLERAGSCVNGIEVVIGAGNICRATGHGGRRNHIAGRVELPFHAGELGHARGLVHTRVLSISAKHGRVLPECEKAR
jgi:hypothetical protein